MWQFVQQNLLLCGAVVAGVLGVVSQVVLRMVYERMVRDMENPGAPKGKYMKQLKQKYNIYRRTQNGTDSINVFIQKSLMDYKFLKMNLHTWRRLGGIALALCGVLGIGGWYLSGQGVATELGRNYLWTTGCCALLIAVAYGLTDTGYRRRYLETGLRSVFTNSSTQAVQEVDLSEEPVAVKAKARPVAQKPILESRKKRGRILENQAQKDKRELKENLAKLKEGISETAAETEHSKERNTDILRQMDPAEQERIIREVLQEFLS